MKIDNEPFDYLSQEQIAKSLRKSKRRSLQTNVMVTSAFVLMILPICTIITFIYYGFGMGESRGNNFVKAIESTILITEPNVFVDRISHDVDIFSLTAFAHLYKQVGLKSKPIDDESYKLLFNNIGEATRKINQEDYFIHPDEERGLNKHRTQRRLENLPEGTVSEMFISFNDFYSEQEVKKLLRNLDIDLLWFAVNVGDPVEENTLLGYPALSGDINTPFNQMKSNDEQFIDVLQFVSSYEKWFKVISRRKIDSLNLEEALHYIDQNGIEIYGVAVTGPTEEFTNINKIEEVRDYYMGDVELWDWR